MRFILRVWFKNLDTYSEKYGFDTREQLKAKRNAIEAQHANKKFVTRHVGSWVFDMVEI